MAVRGRHALLTGIFGSSPGEGGELVGISVNLSNFGDHIRGADTRVCRLDTRVEALFRVDAAFVGIRTRPRKSSARSTNPAFTGLFSIYAAMRKYSGSCAETPNS